MVGLMPDAQPRQNVSSRETVQIEFRADLFDELTEAQGLNTASAKAEAVGIGRMTLHRWTKGETTPSLRDAMKVANQLGVPVHLLFREVRS